MTLDLDFAWNNSFQDSEKMASVDWYLFVSINQVAWERRDSKDYALVLQITLWYEGYINHWLFRVVYWKASSLDARAASWFTYKHHNTVKYLISITPQGIVSFISKGYQGRVSDKYITENCGYLQPGDVVLADRGFNVQESVAYKGATLIYQRLPKQKLNSLQWMWRKYTSWPVWGSMLNMW